MATFEIKIGERRSLIKKDSCSLSIVQQCLLLGLCRSGLYYTSKRQAKPDELDIKASIDKQFTKMLYYGVARMTAYLNQQGFNIGKKRVRHYFDEMCISAIYPKPKSTMPNLEHKTYPYLLSNLVIDRVNQVWSTDITYNSYEWWIYVFVRYNRLALTFYFGMGHIQYSR